MFGLYLLTFNCARNLVDPDSFAPSFFDGLPKSAPVPDLVAISLQEISPIAYSFLGGSYLEPYFERMTATVQRASSLRSHGSEQLQHVATRNLGMTAIMVFAKPQFTERIQWIQSAGAGVGFWNMGNKGAVALRLGISCPDSNVALGITFTAAHLAPMECNVEARNQDWENIVRNLVFEDDDSDAPDDNSIETQPLLAASSKAPTTGHGLFAPGNQIFFAGDLNYRTMDSKPGPDAHHSYPPPAPTEPLFADYAELFKTDQLTREKNANRTLHNLEESPITFPPTYKLNFDSDASKDEQWDFANHRYPSWCDRILYSAMSDHSRLEPLAYTALPAQHTSDHRPVALSLHVDDTHDKSRVDTKGKAPFPINPNWRSRRDIARQLEIAVGILSYLALTKKGNAIVVAFAGTVFASLWMAAWLWR